MTILTIIYGSSIRKRVKLMTRFPLSFFLFAFSLSFLSTVDASSLSCPQGLGFIPVSGNSELGTADFCVMQYEAKAWIDDSPKNKECRPQ